ncbi:MAG TPA: hypothetical protein VGL46_12495 [Pseudonocardiaceae bacterium]|jgi:hypothetical protein
MKPLDIANELTGKRPRISESNLKKVVIFVVTDINLLLGDELITTRLIEQLGHAVAGLSSREIGDLVRDIRTAHRKP